MASLLNWHMVFLECENEVSENHIMPVSVLSKTTFDHLGVQNAPLVRFSIDFAYKFIFRIRHYRSAVRSCHVLSVAVSLQTPAATVFMTLFKEQFYNQISIFLYIMSVSEHVCFHDAILLYKI